MYLHSLGNRQAELSIMEKYVEQAFCHIQVVYRGTGVVRVCVSQGFGRAMRGRLTVVLSDVESYLVSTNHQYSELSCASVSVSSLRLKDLLIYHRMGGN